MTTIINPATGESLAHIAEQTPDELREAVRRARAAQPAWASRSYAERRDHLLRVRDYVVAHADEIARTISAETGKTLVDALSTEVLPAAMAITYYATRAERFLRRKRLRSGSLLTINKRSYVDRVPVGVVGIISPWNYPFAIPFHEVAMALIAGNGAVLKVASQTLQTGEWLRAAVEAGGVPQDLFHLLNVPGSEAGTALLESDISKLFFTGSVVVGKKLMAKAAERLIPVSLELGGNDAMIVCADANLYRAVGGAVWAGISNAGQSCGGVERIFVEAPVYEPFVALLKAQLGKLRFGPDHGQAAEVGSLTTEVQLLKIREMIRDAVDRGAVAHQVHDEHDGRGFHHPPVILTNVDESMLVMTQEIFGPVLAVARVETIDEAVRRANDSRLALTASIWTRSRAKAHAIASRLEVGSVMINDHLMSHSLPETPWGGPKESGIGRTHGYLGLEEMTNPRVVVDDILPGVQKDMWWYPHDRSVYEGLKGAMVALYGKGFRPRVSGLLRMAKTSLRMFRKD